MIVRVTLPSIDRVLRWGALATASLFVGAAGFAAICICVFATTPMYDINCPDYECRPAARDLHSTAVLVKRDQSELPPRAWTSASSPVIEPVRDGARNKPAKRRIYELRELILEPSRP